MQISENLLIAVLAGAFGLIPAVLGWIGQRSQRHARAQKLSELRTELEFLEKWQALRQGVSPMEAGSRESGLYLDSLDEVFARYAESRQHPSGAPDPRDLFWARRLLLLFRPIEPRAVKYHTAYYIVVLASVAMLVSDYRNPTFDADGNSEFGALVLGLLVIFGPLLFFLQRRAVRLSIEHLEGGTTAGSAASPSGHGGGVIQVSRVGSPTIAGVDEPPEKELAGSGSGKPMSRGE